MQRLSELGYRVRTVQRVDERSLWALYRLASFTVFISLVEGFGLPVAESLRCGTPGRDVGLRLDGRDRRRRRGGAGGPAGRPRPSPGRWAACSTILPRWSRSAPPRRLARGLSGATTRTPCGRTSWPRRGPADTLSAGERSAPRQRSAWPVGTSPTPDGVQLAPRRLGRRHARPQVTARRVERREPTGGSGEDRAVDLDEPGGCQRPRETVGGRRCLGDLRAAQVGIRQQGLDGFGERLSGPAVG